MNSEMKLKAIEALEEILEEMSFGNSKPQDNESSDMGSGMESHSSEEGSEFGSSEDKSNPLEGIEVPKISREELLAKMGRHKPTMGNTMELGVVKMDDSDSSKSKFRK